MFMIIFIIIVGFLMLNLAIWYISSVNKMKALSIKVSEALSGIDVALSKRYNVLTKMIEVVKGYAKYEKELLIKISSLREGMSLNEMIEANSSMDKDFNNINLVIEKYPDIKADESFILLQKSIVDVEEHLQAARRIYNYNVSEYNKLYLGDKCEISKL